jgi:hypothetical protein
VPEKVDFPVKKSGPQHFGSHPANNVYRHSPATRAVGKVTVLAVDVAKGCRLQNDKRPVNGLMSIGDH